jgi:hypothetical protein
VLNLWLMFMSAYSIHMKDRYTSSSQVWTTSSERDRTLSDLDPQETASQLTSDSEAYESDGTQASLAKRRKDPRARYKYQELLSEFRTRYTLGILYLGGLILRMPVLLSDFSRWVFDFGSVS